MTPSIPIGVNQTSRITPSLSLKLSPDTITPQHIDIQPCDRDIQPDIIDQDDEC